MNGKQHGEGILIKNGEKKKWLWENGKRVRDLESNPPSYDSNSKMAANKDSVQKIFDVGK